jgi:hypothetical protein
VLVALPASLSSASKFPAHAQAHGSALSRCCSAFHSATDKESASAARGKCSATCDGCSRQNGKPFGVAWCSCVWLLDRHKCHACNM